MRSLNPKPPLAISYISGATPRRSLLAFSHPHSIPLPLLTMDNNRTDKIPHSNPISINTSGHHRYRSSSVSSDSSDGSPSDPIRTPLNSNPPKVTAVSPSTSPFLSYIMGQQTGVAKTLPFRRGTIDSIGSTGPVFDDGRSSVPSHKYPHADVEIDDSQESDPAPLRKVHRRATTSWTTASPPQPMNPLPGDRQERASGLLRRLSLSTSFSRVCCLDKNFKTPSDTLRYSRSQDSPLTTKHRLHLRTRRTPTVPLTGIVQ